MLLLYRTVEILFEIYRWLIIVYIFMSWLPQARETPIGDILRKIVEPYLYPFRRIIPPIGGTIDISPIVALFTLYFIEVGAKTVIIYFGG